MSVNASPIIGIEPIDEAKDVLHVCWALHSHCTNRCSYCNKYSWGGDLRFLRWKDAVGFLDQVFDHYRDKKHIMVSFSGGEPTLWPDFVKLCRLLRKRGCEIGMTSNGVRPLSFWKKIQDDFNWLCLSYHPESVRDEHFMKVVRLLMNRTRLAVRLMMPRKKEHWDRSVRFGEKLRALTDARYLGIEHVPLLTILGIGVPIVYTPEQQKFLEANAYTFVNNPKVPHSGLDRPNFWKYVTVREDGTREELRTNDLVAKGLSRFKGWKCHVGLDQIFVCDNGDVFNAGCRQGPPIGNLKKGNLVFPTRPIVCGKDECFCGTDISVEKRKI